MTEKSVFGKIGTYLFGDEAPAVPTRQTQPALAGMKLPARLPAGTMQLIGLAGVQQALGAEWPKRSEKIFSLVDGVLRRRLDVTDAFYKVDAENYLILFTRLGRREAEFKAKVISDEIQKLVIGEIPEGHDVIVSSSVTEVERGLVLEKVGSLKDLLDYVRSATPPSEYGNVTLFGDDDGTSGAGGDNAPAARGPAVGEGPDMADFDQSLSGLFEKKSIAFFLKECRAGFYPAFSLKRQSFAVFQTAVIHVPTGQPAELVDDPLLENPAELPFQLDRYILTTALLGLHRMLSASKRSIVVMPVSYETLSVTKLRDIYFARLKEVPPGLTRFLGVTVRDIPPGTPASRIAEIMAYVQPFCASRVLHIPCDLRLIDIYADTGCHGYATRGPEAEPDAAKRFQTLTAFTKRAALHRMECILTDATSHDDVSTGIATGFTFVSGDAVAGMVATPGHIQGIRADHLLGQMRVPAEPEGGRH